MKEIALKVVAVVPDDVAEQLVAAAAQIDCQALGGHKVTYGSAEAVAVLLNEGRFGTLKAVGVTWFASPQDGWNAGPWWDDDASLVEHETLPLGAHSPVSVEAHS